ncbi:Serine/threonine-protein kinase MRCK gamma, partial [Coemansia sp. RSA 2703]
FVAGGDLFSMLDRCENAVIDEDAARFYAAELVLALEDLHALGYVHRDCKPQNTLLDARGHVKLADFGSCARIGARGAHEASTAVPVGTCDYIAPETLRARELGNEAAGSVASDWWSVGAVLYEMLYGDPPFYSDSVPETYGKIMASERHLAFDAAVDVSEAAKDLMRRLLVRQEERLGVAGIKAHQFFASVDWSRVREQPAPFVPSIRAPDDTSNFSVGDDPQDASMAAARASCSRLGHGRSYAGEQLPFIGFTYPPPMSVQRPATATAARGGSPRGPRDDPAQVKALSARLAQMQAAWDAERARVAEERRALELRCAALEAQAQAQAAVHVPAVRDSAMQTDAEAGDARVAERLQSLADSVAAATRASGDRLHAELQAQRAELSALAARLAPEPGPTPGSAARLSLGTTRRAVSAVSSVGALDASQADVHGTSVVATLVGDGRAPHAASASAQRVARADRRVSAGVAGAAGMAGDGMALIAAKCDRLAALLEQHSGDLEHVRQTQAALMQLCGAQPSSKEEGSRMPGIPESPAGSRRGRRRTEQPRGTVSSAASPDALEAYRTAAEELAASLRSRLAACEEARAAAEARAADLLAWIGRESKGRALLEDMIRTAQHACKLAEDKFAAMAHDDRALRDQLDAAVVRAEDLQAQVEARDKELRLLRRASRRAIDQLAEIKPPQVGEQRVGGVDAELQEAAAVHVRLQFEIARLEGDVSRLQSENARLAKDLAIKESRLKVAESRTPAAHPATSSSSSDGIRVRPVDENDDDRFASIGSKSHRRFKVQLQNMQKHIELLETKLAMAVSENEHLK